MRIVYVSGQYRGNIKDNIQRARLAAEALWREGYAVICPHLNTAHMDGIIPDGQFLEGDLEILGRLIPDRDMVYMLKGWEQSEGAKMEKEYAEKIGLEIIYENSDDDKTIVSLEPTWLQEWVKENYPEVGKRKN